MPKSVTGMLSKRGFTLIEILVVIVIIGITVTFALLAFGDFGTSRKIIVAAEQFADFGRLVRQQAILSSSTLGVSINKNSYQALKFYPPGSWKPLSAKGIFHIRSFPDSASIFLESNIKLGNPAIIINASGEMTPFKLHVGTTKDDVLATIIGQPDGTISLELS